MQCITTRFDGCKFKKFGNLNAGRVAGWLAQQATVTSDKASMAARTRNSDLIALRTFLNWSVERDRLPLNPLVKLGRADERSDRRRHRRALGDCIRQGGMLPIGGLQCRP